MRRVSRLQRSRNEAGASAVEYGLLVALIAAVIVLAVFALGQVVHGSYSGTCQNMEDTVPMNNSADCNA
jgi:pilus assembly protein Flp/PilA